MLVVDATYSPDVLMGEVAVAEGIAAAVGAVAVVAGADSAVAGYAAADGCAAAVVARLRLLHLLLLGLLRWLFSIPTCICYLAATSLDCRGHEADIPTLVG